MTRGQFKASIGSTAERQRPAILHLMAPLSELPWAVAAIVVACLFLLLQPILIKFGCYSRQTRWLVASTTGCVTHACIWQAYWRALLSLQGSADKRQVLLACVQSSFDRVADVSEKHLGADGSSAMRCKACAGRVPQPALAHSPQPDTRPQHRSKEMAMESELLYSKACAALWNMVAERRRQSDQMIPTFSSPSPLLHTPAAIKESLDEDGQGCCVPSTTAFYVRTKQQTVSCGHCKRVYHAGCVREYLHRAVSTFRQGRLDHIAALLLETGLPPCHLCCEDVDSLNSMPSLTGPGGSRGRAKTAAPHRAKPDPEDQLSPCSSTDYVPTRASSRKQQSRRGVRASAKCAPIAEQPADAATERSLSAPTMGATATSLAGDPSGSPRLTVEMV